MARPRFPEHRSVDRNGFTRVEMLISLVVSLVVLGASLSFVGSTFRGADGNKLREEVYRSARFIGMSLERDIQTTGVGIESEIRFGTLSTFNDTLVVLHVPVAAHECVSVPDLPTARHQQPTRPRGNLWVLLHRPGQGPRRHVRPEAGGHSSHADQR